MTRLKVQGRNTSERAQRKSLQYGGCRSNILEALTERKDEAILGLVSPDMDGGYPNKPQFPTSVLKKGEKHALRDFLF